VLARAPARSGINILVSRITRDAENVIILSLAHKHRSGLERPACGRNGHGERAGIARPSSQFLPDSGKRAVRRSGSYDARPEFRICRVHGDELHRSSLNGELQAARFAGLHVLPRAPNGRGHRDERDQVRERVVEHGGLGAQPPPEPFLHNARLVTHGLFGP